MSIFVLITTFQNVAKSFSEVPPFILFINKSFPFYNLAIVVIALFSDKLTFSPEFPPGKSSIKIL